MKLINRQSFTTLELIVVLTILGVGGVTLAESLTTGAPSGGTAAAWKLGIKVDAVSALDAAHYLQVDVGGVAYKIALIA